MINVVGYARFSSDNQRQESIDAQVRAIEEYCLKNGYNLIKVYKDEAVTGTSFKEREQFLEMIDDSKNKLFEFVIVHKFDRFARNRYDHIICEKKLNNNGVKLLSVLEQLNDSPESVILKSVLQGMNEYYSLNLAREVKKGLKENALKCIHTGGIPPLGYDIGEDRKYIINEIEADSVRLIFKLYNEGMGYASISDYLNSLGRKNKRGLPFRKTSIRDILLNEKYIGVFVFGKKDAHGHLTGNEIKIDNGLPAIVDKEIFYLVEAKMKKRKTGTRSTAHIPYYLTGVCYCGECGGKFSGGYRAKNRNGDITYGYTCINRKAKVNDCKNKPIRKELLEDTVFNLIKKEIFTEKRIQSIASKVVKTIEERNLAKGTQLEKIEKELGKLKEQNEKLLSLFLKGRISDELFNKKHNELSTEITFYKQEMMKYTSDKKIDRETVLKFLYIFKENFKKEQTKKALIETFVKEIKVYEKHVEIVLRLFPLYIDSSGGSGGNRTRVRN